MSPASISAQRHCRAVAEAGVSVVESAHQAAADRDVVFTMLPAGEHVIDVYCGGDGILAAVGPARS